MAHSRRPSRRLPYRVRRLLIWGLLLIVVILLRELSGPRLDPPPESLVEGVYRVDRVVDGDTLVVEDCGRVRLIGADTPETVRPNHPVEPFGPEATDFTRQFLVDGDQQVRLQFDGPRTDKYGRVLAYVWVGDQMLNEELIRAGLARVRTDFPYSVSMKSRFRAAQTEAEAAGRGIWSLPGGRL